MGGVIDNNNNNVGSGGTGGSGKSKSSQDGSDTQGREFRRPTTYMLREQGREHQQYQKMFGYVRLWGVSGKNIVV